MNLLGVCPRVCVILFSACKQSKQGIVQDLLEAENHFEKEKVNQFLSDSFMFYGPETLNKEGYLSRVDSLKSIDCQSTILKIQVLDSIVKTEERELSIIDSLLEVNPAIIRKKTYDKKEYRRYAHLQGTYVSKDCAFYRKLIFKGKKTVTIVDAIFGMSFASGYELDEDIIRVKTDKSDLLFEIKDSQTLIGEGFAKGTFRKAN